VDINCRSRPSWGKMDLYQQAHFSRYVFASMHISPTDVCGDLACGTAYGAYLLSSFAAKVVGVDRDRDVIEAVRLRYAAKSNLELQAGDLLDLDFSGVFDKVVSFETLEHFCEEDLSRVLVLFRRSLKSKGMLLLSAPYMQPEADAVGMGFHLAWDIDEQKIAKWLAKSGFHSEAIYYQAYADPLVQRELDHPDFIVCVARKSE
jgi:SAM-dependent methyltransferase